MTEEQILEEIKEAEQLLVQAGKVSDELYRKANQAGEERSTLYAKVGKLKRKFGAGRKGQVRLAHTHLDKLDIFWVVDITGDIYKRNLYGLDGGTSYMIRLGCAFYDEESAEEELKRRLT